MTDGTCTCIASPHSADPLCPIELHRALAGAYRRGNDMQVERDRYREALHRIAETPFSPEPGWRHWRLIAATALREGVARGGRPS